MRKKISVIQLSLILTGIAFALLYFLGICGVSAAPSPHQHVFFAAELAVTTVLFLIFIFRVVLPANRRKRIYDSYTHNPDLDLLLRTAPLFSNENNYYEAVIKKNSELARSVMDNSKLAEYLALQNQINPHFLYNTLEAIRSDALIAGMDDLANTAERLAAFFRYTISTHGDFFTVNDELDNIRNYMTIQNYRFGDILNLKIDLKPGQEEVLHVPIPKLTLQPIVENAIRHGLETKISGGTITVSFEMTDRKLIISIRDDGVGMDEETLKKLQQNLTDPQSRSITPKQGTHGIALQNVNARIKLLCGTDYGLNILSKKGVGTDVQITLPLVQHKD